MSASPGIHVAIVEDDAILREEIGVFLRREGFIVHEADSAWALDEILVRHRLHAVVVDIGLPGHSGLALAQRLRKQHPDVGILVLTARTGLPDRLASYDAGADIYLPKPASPLELLAAIRSVLRRVVPPDPGQSWLLEMESGRLHAPGIPTPVSLSEGEARLLRALAASVMGVVPGHDLCVALRRHEQERAISRRALEVKISRVRQKMLSLAPELPHGGVRSDWNHGYQLLVRLRVQGA